MITVKCFNNGLLFPIHVLLNVEIILIIFIHWFFYFYRIACGIIARSSGLFENNKKICACDGVTLWEERDVPLAGPSRQRKNKII